jgi:integrase
MKPVTVNRIFQFLSAAINHGLRTEAIRGLKNPCSLVRKLPENNVRDIVITEGQFETLYRCLADHLKPVVATAYYTGARKTEILTLLKKDVDFFQNTVYFRDTKNGGNRYVPIAPELKEILLCLVRECPESPYVFTHNNGERVKYVKEAFRRACTLAGPENLRFHDLRHTALTNWANAGHNHFRIMKASGHKTLSCFQRYLSFGNQDLQKLVLGKSSNSLETGQTVEIAKAM